MYHYRSIFSGRTKQATGTVGGADIDGRRLGRLLDGTQWVNPRSSRRGGGLIGTIGSWGTGGRTFGPGTSEVLQSLGWMGYTFGTAAGSVSVPTPPIAGEEVGDWLVAGGKIVIGLPDFLASQIDSLYSALWAEDLSEQLTEWLSDLSGHDVPPVLDPYTKPFVPAEYAELEMDWLVDATVPGIVLESLTRPVSPHSGHVPVQSLVTQHINAPRVALALGDGYDPIAIYSGSQLAADYQASSDPGYRAERSIAQWSGSGVIAASLDVGAGRIYLLQRDFGPFRSVNPLSIASIPLMLFEIDRSLHWLIDWHDDRHSALIGPEPGDDAGWDEIL